jgi:FkbM family methyltransferase
LEKKSTNKFTQLIRELPHAHRLPVKLIAETWKYYFQKALGRNMVDSYGEWVYVLYKTTIKAKGKVYRYNDRYWGLKTNGGEQLLIRNFPSSDVKVLLQVWGVKEYEGAIDKLLSIWPSSRPIKMIDAGANVGYTSIFFKSYFPNATIVAIEPSDINFKVLQENIAINRLKFLYPKKAALWYRKAFLKVSQLQESGLEWQFSVTETDYGGIESLGPDDIMQEMNWSEIDVLKMDIEGAERYFFLENSNNEWLDSIQFLIIEVHPIENLEQTVCSILEKKGFNYFNYGELKVAYKEQP